MSEEPPTLMFFSSHQLEQRSITQSSIHLSYQCAQICMMYVAGMMYLINSICPTTEYFFFVGENFAMILY